MLRLHSLIGRQSATMPRPKQRMAAHWLVDGLCSCDQAQKVYFFCFRAKACLRISLRLSAKRALITLVITHIYFAVRPDKWWITKSMFSGHRNPFLVTRICFWITKTMFPGHRNLFLGHRNHSFGHRNLDVASENHSPGHPHHGPPSPQCRQL